MLKPLSSSEGPDALSYVRFESINIGMIGRVLASVLVQLSAASADAYMTEQSMEDHSWDLGTPSRSPLTWLMNSPRLPRHS
eukprot:24730-Eustigmatos_ZCMA.PRE.1